MRRRPIPVTDGCRPASPMRRACHESGQTAQFFFMPSSFFIPSFIMPSCFMPSFFVIPSSFFMASFDIEFLLHAVVLAHLVLREGGRRERQAERNERGRKAEADTGRGGHGLVPLLGSFSKRRLPLPQRRSRDRLCYRRHPNVRPCHG